MRVVTKGEKGPTVGLLTATGERTFMLMSRPTYEVARDVKCGTLHGRKKLYILPG